jgi:glycerophosphoryl diester phosphodiesterase
VNDPGAMRRLARRGVDGILSDNPALLRRMV